MSSYRGFRCPRPAVAAAAVGLLFSSLAPVAGAVPSFSRQTGMPCSMCHTSFPILTPFGRAFKASAYNLSISKQVIGEGDEGTRRTLELAGLPALGVMLQTSYTHTNQAQNLTAGAPPANNDDFQLPQQLSLLYAGKIAPGVGAFIQVTYNSVADHFSADNTDLRYAHTVPLFDKDLVFGFTANNNPTVSDLWNSSPAWGFPFASSNVAPTPAGRPLLLGTLAQAVAGVSAYAFWNSMVYAEIGAYRSAPLGVPRPFDASTGATSIIAGMAPYWRVMLQEEWGLQSLAIGTFGLAADIFPGGTVTNNSATPPITTVNPLSGPTNKYIDAAVDAQYQYIGEKHILSLFTSALWETQQLEGSQAIGAAANLNNSLFQFAVNGSYLYDRLIGATLGFTLLRGATDTGVFASAPVVGSASGNPRSTWFTAQVNYIPWLNLQLILQYISYIDFNGGATNYDGSGRHASANNTVYAVLWLAF